MSQKSKEQMQKTESVISLDRTFKSYSGKGNEHASTYFVDAKRVSPFVEGRLSETDKRGGVKKEVTMFQKDGVVLKEEKVEDIFREVADIHAFPPEVKSSIDLSYNKQVLKSLHGLLTDKTGSFDQDDNFFYKLCAPSAYLAGEVFRKNAANIAILKGVHGVVTPTPLGFTLDKNGTMFVLEEMVHGDEVAVVSYKGVENFGRANKMIGPNEHPDRISTKRYSAMRDAALDYNINMLKKIADAPKEHWQQLINTCYAFARSRVPVDLHAENLFYHETQGFPVIDFSTIAYDRGKRDETFSDKNQVDLSLSGLLGSIMDFHQKNRYYRFDDFLEAYSAVQRRLESVMEKEKMPNHFVKNTKNNIDNSSRQR